MKQNTIDEVEILRNARKNCNAVYMKFAEDNKNFSNYAFCFFEGEDAKYYNSRIKKYFQNNFLTYSVGNKKEVLKLMKKIKNDLLYENIITMFFIDNDFDESLKGVCIDLYETPCYSIENLYAQKEVFKDILQSEFGINQAHEDFEKCISDFENRFQEFMFGMEEFNALALFRRKNSDANSNVKFGDIKTTHLFEISVLEIKKSNRYDENINNIKRKLDIQQYELQQCIEELGRESNPFMRYRGKNQLDFFCIFLKVLKELNDKGGYFVEKHNCVKLNITGNRLSELSQYALTPECLELFLENHFKKISLSSLQK